MLPEGSMCSSQKSIIEHSSRTISFKINMDYISIVLALNTVLSS